MDKNWKKNKGQDQKNLELGIKVNRKNLTHFGFEAKIMIMLKTKILMNLEGKCFKGELEEIDYK